MKILSFDISSNNTGWSFIDIEDHNDKDVIKHYECGNISSPPKMDIFQKLYFFGNEISKIIEKWEPDQIGIEEAIVVYGHGFKTARTLSRFSGVALYFAYNYKKQPIHIYEPTHWRKALGLSGSCHKTEVQLVIVKMLGLLDEKATNFYNDRILEEHYTLSKMKDEYKFYVDNHKKETKEKIKEVKVHLKEAKKNKDTSSETELEKKIKSYESEEKKHLKEYKKQYEKDEKKAKVQFNKNLDKLGIDIHSDTGIDNNISDSFGIGFCILKELK